MEKKGKVLVKWERENVEGIDLKEVSQYSQNVEIDWSLGCWFMVSLTNEMEEEVQRLVLKRGMWNMGGMVLTIIWCVFAVVTAYDVKNNSVTDKEGLISLGLYMALILIYWVYWQRGVNQIRKKVKLILAAAICVDGFTFCKNGFLEDETIKGRAEAYGEKMNEVNEAFKNGWFNVHYVVPKSFETLEEYDKRLRDIVFTVVRSTELNMIKNDVSVFLDVNKRQVGEIENDFLIEK